MKDPFVFIKMHRILVPSKVAKDIGMSASRMSDLMNEKATPKPQEKLRAIAYLKYVSGLIREEYYVEPVHDESQEKTPLPASC